MKFYKKVFQLLVLIVFMWCGHDVLAQYVTTDDGFSYHNGNPDYLIIDSGSHFYTYADLNTTYVDLNTRGKVTMTLSTATVSGTTNQIVARDNWTLIEDIYSGKVYFKNYIWCDKSSNDVKSRHNRSVYYKLKEKVFENGIDITHKDYNSNVEMGTIPGSPSANSRERDNYLYLDRNLPFCGASEGATYYLDLQSCKYELINGIAYISCNVYSGGGGADNEGNPAKVSVSIMKFSTYKTENGRVIKFLGTASNNTPEYLIKEYNYDNGFLKGLFWKAANASGISSYLD